MNFPKPFLLACGLGVLLLQTGCQTSAPRSVSYSAPPPELTEEQYLFEIIRHLYRWQLDESEIDHLVTGRDMRFWVRRVEPKLDPGDRSILGEIILPQLGIPADLTNALLRAQG